MRIPDPKANTTTEAYLAYKAGYLEESELKPVLYEPYLHFDAWLAYWAGLTSDYPHRIGKNLLNASADTGSSNGVNYIKNGDGTYTANGTANGSSSFVVGSIELTANTQYVISGCPSNGSGSSYNVRIRDANYAALGFDVGNGATITPTETKTYYYQITVVSGYSVSNLVFKPMICLSTTSNPDYAHYEPYTGEPEMLTDEEALVAYLSGVTDTYPEEIKDPYDVRIVGYLKHLASIRWPEPDYPVNNEEFYLSTMEPTHTSNPEPSADIELDTTEGKIISVEAYGDTYQQTYSGKNLFNYQGVVNLGIATTIAGRSTYRGYYIQANAGDTFTLSRATTTGNNRFRVCFTMVEPARGVDAYNENGVVERYISADDATEVSFTVPQDMHYVFIYLDNSGQDITESLKIQLETGSTATAYEPYVGGIPAPNPDYPQDIQVVTGEQTVDVTGKNKINGAYSEISQTVRCSAEASGNGFKITSTSSSGATYVTVPIPNITSLLGQTVALSYSASGSGIRIGFFYLNSSGDATGAISYTQTTTLPSSLGDNTGIGIVFYTSNNGSATYNDIQLEIGSTTTAYQPYQSQSYPISLGSTELCKIGDYQDYIYKSGDDWYVHKETGKIDLTNTSGWWASGTHTIKNSLTNLGISNIHTVGVNRKTEALCNYLAACPSNRLYQGTDTVGFGISDGFYFSNNDWSLGDFNTFKSNNQILVCYELDTPTDTKITDDSLAGQLEALAGADTYNEKTYIKVTATDPNLPALLKVEAYKY